MIFYTLLFHIANSPNMDRYNKEDSRLCLHIFIHDQFLSNLNMESTKFTSAMADPQFLPKSCTKIDRYYYIHMAMG